MNGSCHPRSRACLSLRQSSAFTRMDLLAVLSASSLLLLLTPPLAGNNQVHSRLATCLDNHRRLAIACQMYASDNAGWFPPNNDDGTTVPGFAWVGGQSGPGGGQEFNGRLLADPSRSLLANYVQRDPLVFRCPTDLRTGLDQSPLGAGETRQRVGAARSVAMNAAVGVNPYARAGKQPADGAWLDNNHGHTYGRTWLTYGRESQLTVPGPASTALILDEDGRSVNDGLFAFGMQSPEWIDWPTTSHDGAGTLSFADAHVEAHRWVDSRTPVGTLVNRRPVPGSPDYAWLRERISARRPN